MRNCRTSCAVESLITISFLAPFSTREEAPLAVEPRVRLDLLVVGLRDLMILVMPNSKFPLAQYSVPITRFTMHRWKFCWSGW